MREQAILQIVLEVKEALTKLDKLEAEFKSAVADINRSLDRVEGDELSEETQKLITRAQRLGEAYVRTGERATGAMREMAQSGRVSGKSLEDLEQGIKGVDKRLDNARKSMKAFSKSGESVERVRARFVRLEATVRKLGSLFGGLSIAFLALGTVRKLSDFSLKMAEVQAVTRATKEEFDALSAAAVDLGEKTIFSTTEVAEGMALLGRAGFETGEILESMPGLLSLAAAGNLGLAEAVEIASNSLRAFKLDAAEMPRVADALAAAASAANTSVRQLGEAMKFVGPVAAGLEIPIEDVASAIGVLSNKGIQAETAGTALRRILASLAAPTKNVTTALAQLGLTIDDVNPEMRSLTEIMRTLQTAGLGVTEAFLIAGQRGGPALLALASASPKLEELNAQISESIGRSREMADVMQSNLSGAFKRLTSAVEGLTIKTGEGGLTSALETVINSLAIAVRRAEDFSKIIFGIGGSIVGVLQLPFLALAETIGLLVKSFDVLFAQLAKAPLIGSRFEEASEKLGELNRSVEFGVDVVEQWTKSNLLAIKQVKEGFQGLTQDVDIALEQQEKELDAAITAVKEYAREVQEAGGANEVTAKQIRDSISQVLNKISELPEAQRTARLAQVKELQSLREAYREVGAVIRELSEEEFLAVQALGQETEKFLSAVRGNKEELERQAEAIIQGINILKTEGAVAQEVAVNIGREVARLLVGFAEVGAEAPKALKALAQEFPLLGDSARGAARGIRETGASAEKTAEQVRRLAEQSEAAKAALDRLNEAQSRKSDAEQAVQSLSEELEGLRDKTTLTVEELNREAELQAILSKTRLESRDATAEATVAQNDYNEMIGEGAKEQIFFGDTAEEAAAGVDALAGAIDGFDLGALATASVAEDFRGIADSAPDAAQGIQKTGEAAEEAAEGLQELPKSVDELKASFPGLGAIGEEEIDRILGKARALNGEMRVAIGLCKELNDCLQELGT